MGKKSKKKNSGTDRLLKDFARFFKILLDYIICIYLILIVAVLPLYNHWDYSHIGSEKIAFLWSICKPFAVSVIACGSLYILFLCVGWFLKNGWRPRKIGEYLQSSYSITDFFVAAYGIIVIVSYLFSDYKERALMGRSSWGMGALIQISFVLSYFCISRVWKRRKWMICLALPASAVLFVLGYFNRFGLYPIPMKASGNADFISLVGNINWYCGYMIMPIFAVMCYAWGMGFSDLKRSLLLGAYLFAGFAALVTNGSSSGMLTLMWMFFLVLLWSVAWAGRMQNYLKIVLLLAAACLFTLLLRCLFPGSFTYPNDMLVNLFTKSPLPFLMLALAVALTFLLRYWREKGTYPAKVFRMTGRVLLVVFVLALVLFVCLIVVNTLVPGSIGPLSGIPVFTFSDTWGSNRGVTWKAGVWLWSELAPWKKLIGIGSDTMDLHIKLGASEALRSYVYSIWPNNPLTNAHCEPLTVLVHNGLWGMIAFVGLLVTSSYRYLKQLTFEDSRSCLIASCGAAIAAYMVNNLFSFQQVMNGPTMFVILGIGEAYYRLYKNTSPGIGEGRRKLENVK